MSPAPCADTDWSEPGETADKPDRYQWRTLGGLALSAGSNTRDRAGRYMRADAPWSVSARLATVDECAPILAAFGDAASMSPRSCVETWSGSRIVEVRGAEPEQAQAREAAERVARRWLEIVAGA